MQLQHYIINSYGKQRATYILNHLSTDDRVAFLSSLKGIEQTKYLDFLNEKNKATTQGLLGFPENSVARLVNTDFATISPGMTVGEASVHLRENHKDSEAANVIYVVDEEGKLIDDILVRRLILNAPSVKIDSIMMAIM